MTARKHVPGGDSQYSPPSPGWVPCSRRIPIFWDDFAYYTNLLWAHIEAQDKKIKQLEKRMADQQVDIDALDAALVQEASDLNVAVGGIQTEIADLQAQIAAGVPAPQLNLSNLQAHATALAAAVASAAALVPAPPAP